MGLNGNRAQLAGPTTGGAAGPTTFPGVAGGSIFETGEVGLHLAYSYFLSDAWAIALSGGFDVGRVTFQPKSGHEETFSSNSWNARLGFDRYAFITDGVALYAGPGLLFWTGSAQYEGRLGSPNINFEWPQVKQIGVNGRIGMYARFAPHYGLFGHISQVIAHNKADDYAGESTWWSSHHEGSVGVAVDF